MLLTELPVYLYHHEEVPQRGDGALFHFTKLDSFLKSNNKGGLAQRLIEY